MDPSPFTALGVVDGIRRRCATGLAVTTSGGAASSWRAWARSVRRLRSESPQPEPKWWYPIWTRPGRHASAMEWAARSWTPPTDAIFATAEADGASPVTASKALAEAVLARGPRQGNPSSFEDIRGRLKD